MTDELNAYAVVLDALRQLFPRMLAPERVAAAAVVALEQAGMLRRLALFAGDYWGGPYDGGTDYRGTFDRVEAAIATLPPPHEVESGWGCAYAQVLDLVTGEQVAWLDSTYAPPGESVWLARS